MLTKEYKCVIIEKTMQEGAMELQTTGGQVDLTQKKNMAKFVHDVADMEVRAFTLREAAKNIRIQLNKDRESMQIQCRGARSDANHARKAYEAKQKEADTYSFRDYCKYRRSGGRIVAFLFMHYFCGAMFVVPTVMIGVEVIGFPAIINVILGFMAAGAYFALFFLLWGLVKSRNWKRYVGELRVSRDQLKVKYEEKEAEARKNEKELEVFEKKAEEIEIKLKKMENQAQSIEKDIRSCYSLDVIMPSYRNLISVVILDEIFLNDKADTMREANLICDTEIRHAELMGKLDQIIHALQSLALSLQYATSVLNSINENVSMISQDVYRMAEGQERIAYATESLKKSADNVDFYIAQKRAGSF